MANIILFPVGRDAARKHYESSMKNGFELQYYHKYIDLEGLNKIYYGEGKKVTLWGMNSTKRLGTIYSAINEGDLAMFIQDGNVISYAMVLMKMNSSKLSEDVWESSNGART